jgi:NADH-quinone oxidoreductase subunit K
MGSITLMHFLLLSGILFAIGVWGMLINRDSPVHSFISLQIIFIAITLGLISLAVGAKDLNLQVLSLFVSIVRVVEFVIGISILFRFYRDIQK